MIVQVINSRIWSCTTAETCSVMADKDDAELETEGCAFVQSPEILAKADAYALNGSAANNLDYFDNAVIGKRGYSMYDAASSSTSPSLDIFSFKNPWSTAEEKNGIQNQDALLRIERMLEVARRKNIQFKDIMDLIPTPKPTKPEPLINACEYLESIGHIYEFTRYVQKYFRDPYYFPEDTPQRKLSIYIQRNAHERDFGFCFVKPLKYPENTEVQYLIVTRISLEGGMSRYNKVLATQPITVFSKIYAVNGNSEVLGMMRELKTPTSRNSQAGQREERQSLRIIVQLPFGMEEISQLYEQGLRALNYDEPHRDQPHLDPLEEMVGPSKTSSFVQSLSSKEDYSDMPPLTTGHQDSHCGMGVAEWNSETKNHRSCQQVKLGAFSIFSHCTEQRKNSG